MLGLRDLGFGLQRLVFGLGVGARAGWLVLGLRPGARIAVGARASWLVLGLRPGASCRPRSQTHSLVLGSRFALEPHCTLGLSLRVRARTTGSGLVAPSGHVPVSVLQLVSGPAEAFGTALRVGARGSGQLFELEPQDTFVPDSR